MESTISSKIATTGSISNKGIQFLNLSYWFSSPEAASLASLYFLEILSTVVFIIPLIILGFRLARNLTPPVQKFLNKIVLYSIWFGPVGWLLISFRVLGVVFLSARFWWVLWFLALAFAGFILYRNYKNEFAFSVKRYQAYQLKKKYLPKRKKR